MSGPKIVIVVLIVIAVLFAIGIGAGVSNSGDQSKDDEQAAREFKPGDWIKSIGGALTPFSPKLEPQQMQPLNAGAGIRNKTFSVALAPVAFRVSPSDDKFRKASFTLISGSGLRIVYEAANKDAGKLSVQEWPKSGDDPRRASLVIFNEGGKLTFICAGTSPCAVRLE